MKLLLVGDHLGSGGAQRQLVTLARGLKHAGHEVDVFVYHGRLAFFRPDLEEAGINVIVGSKSTRFSAAPVHAIADLIAGGGYSGIVAYLRTPSVYAICARMLARNRTRLIVSERSSAPSGRLSRLDRLYLGWFQFADHIVTNSLCQREIILRSMPRLRQRISVVYNGIDLNRFRPRQRPRPDEEVRLLSVGTIEAGKNCHRLAHAIVLMKRRYGWNPRVTWVGRFSGAESQRIRDEVEAILAEAHLQDQWIWLGERRNIADLLPEFDAMMHPSLFEGCSNAIAEAMASGLPVLAGAVADNQRIVGDTGAGVLFDPADPLSIAGAIQGFFSLPPQVRRGFSGRARSAAETLFSANRLVAEYERLLSGSAGLNEAGWVSPRAGLSI